MGNNESAQAAQPIPSPTSSRLTRPIVERPLAYGSNLPSTPSEPTALSPARDRGSSPDLVLVRPVRRADSDDDETDGPPVRRSSASPTASSSSSSSSISSISSSISSSLASEPTFDFTTGCLLHPLQKSDTLAGLAVRYGARVEDIKRVNKLWNANDIWMLKVLKIPTDLNQYRAAQEAAIAEKQAATRREFLQAAALLLEKEPAPVDDVPDHDAELSDDVARSYLEATRYQLDAALRRWREDINKQRFMYDNTSSQSGSTQLLHIDSARRQQLENLDDEVFGL